MKIEYRPINDSSKVKPLFSASPVKKILHYAPKIKPKAKRVADEYAESWKNGN